MKRIVQEQARHTSGGQDHGLQGNFWVFGGLVCILLVSILGRDMGRPFTGLHSWGEAHAPWVTRVHLKYGLGYTKGYITWAVGDPPTQNPVRYLDHPQLSILIDAVFMAILGINDWSLRVVNVLATVITLLLFLKILRGLADDKAALLAGLLFCLFPLTGYFGVYMWLYPLLFWAIWAYLVLIKGLKDGPEPRATHKWALAAGLFLALQISWEGFFFALGIGVHYVCRCIRRRQFPDKQLLAILVIAPLSSLIIDFTILAAGRGWDFQRLFELYKWRAGAGEMERHDWGKWFAQLWEHAVTNFSLPVLIIGIGYLTLGQLYVFTTRTSPKERPELWRAFPQFWLFLLPAVFQLFMLKGALWKHQAWERPLTPVVSIAAALGILLLADIVAKIRPLLGKICTAALVGIITICCARGLNYYCSITHFSPEKVKLFKMLNERIPPDKMLLSFETFKVKQHPAKGEHYRPEVAWYLDRETVQATALSEIQKQAQTGRFPCYLMPTTYYDKETSAYLAKLSNELQQRYKVEAYLPADPGGPNRAPMLPYLIFDLQSKAAGS